MRNRKIQDLQINASSEWDWFHGPKNARLFFTPRNGRTGAWSSKTKDLEQWLQVDFKHQTVVSGISTQGREGCCSQWVKTYMLQYSMDGISFFPYMYNGQVKVSTDLQYATLKVSIRMLWVTEFKYRTIN